MDKIEAIRIARKYKSVLRDFIKIDNMYLFGSHALNSGRDDSDIDIAIVVSEIPDDYFAVNPMLWKLRRQVDDRIEPILIEKENDRSGFLEDIKQYGIEI
jgi:uncharacterized protein